MKTKLRLLITEKCNRNCEGCCNKDWNLKNLPICENFSEYNEIFLTGGEPLLNHNYTLGVLACIRRLSKAKIYIYTAMPTNTCGFIECLNKADGMTLTLHDQDDVLPFLDLQERLPQLSINGKSLRLNIFKDIYCFPIKRFWKVKSNIEWIKNCPLPEDEVFMRL